MSDVQKTNSINDICIPTPEIHKTETDYFALKIAIDKIEEAKRNGKYSCYIAASGNDYVSKEVIQKLLDVGYDVIYNYFERGDDWFIIVSWKEGCSGKVYNENYSKLSSIDEMFLDKTKDVSKKVYIIPTSDTSWNVDDKYDIVSADDNTVLFERIPIHEVREIIKQNIFIVESGEKYL